MPRTSRRRFLALGGTGVVAAALWGRLRPPGDTGVTAQSASGAGDGVASVLGADGAPRAEAARATPTQPPPPVKERGAHALTLLAGTPWETPAVEISSGEAGTRMMVLGGVHGNEPGGWLAAEAITSWMPERGSLLVVPRANRASTRAMERTLAGYGDLNRLYPGDPNGLPMARMAAEVVSVAREFRPDWLFDLHESWAFYNERGASSGTAFLGQTVSVGVRGEPVDRIAAVVDAVNGEISERERLVLRTTTSRPPSSATATASGPNTVFGGATSLSLGNWVPGCVPVLIEMGQQEQTDARRSALHQMVVRTALQQSGML